MIQIKQPNLLENTKKLDISKFFEGQEGFVTIKKLTKTEKLKWGLYINRTCDIDLLKNAKNKEEISNFFDNIDITNDKDSDFAVNLVETQYHVLFNLAVDKKNHSFIVEKEGDFELTYDSFCKAFPDNLNLLIFIVENIKEFNSDFLLLPTSEMN